VILKRYSLTNQKEAFLKELKLLSKLTSFNQIKQKQKHSNNLNVPQIISYKSDKIVAEILMNDAGIDLTQILCTD
jgi:hypothetical protein